MFVSERQVHIQESNGELIGHFYNQQGLPIYEVENKSKGGMRPATVADAKKLGLVPSVTEILKIVYSGSLQDWIKQQIVDAAWGIRTKDILYEVWKLEVLQLANEISRTAADRGGEIHDAIEKWFKGETVEKYIEWQVTFAEWYSKQDWFKYIMVVQNEGYIKTDYGYGGRYDLFVISDGRIGRKCGEDGTDRIIIDYKTQNTKGKPFVFYRSWGRQLAAYAQALGATRLISVAIDSYDSKKIESYEWTNYEELLEEFNCAKKLYYSENDSIKPKGDKSGTGEGKSVSGNSPTGWSGNNKGSAHLRRISGLL